MSPRPPLLRNVLSNWVALGANLLIAFFLSPFLVRSLGPDMYGLWVLVLSITGYMGLLDSGLKISIVRFVSQAQAGGDSGAVNRVLGTSLVIYGVATAAALLLTMIMAGQVERWFRIPPDALDEARHVFVLGGVTVALTLLMSVFGGLLAGLQRYDEINKVNVAVLLVRSAVIIVLVWQGFGVVWLAGIHLASQVMVGALLVAAAYRVHPGLSLRWPRLEAGTARMLLGYSGFVFLNNVAMFMLFYSGEVVLGIFVGTASVTFYAIARSLVQYLSSIVGAMTQVFHPYASDQHARGNEEALRAALHLGTKTSLLVALPIGVTYVLMGRTFVALWMGPEFADVSGGVLVILAVAQMFWLAQSSTGNILLGIGRHKAVTVINAATGLASLALSVLLVGRFGVYGVAFGTSLPIVVSQAIVLPGVALSALRVSAREYLSRSVLGPLVAAACYAGTLWLARSVATPGTLLEFGAEVALCLVVFIVPAYFLCFDSGERQRYFGRYLRLWAVQG